jgi:RHS repeat-associated protein
MTNVDYPNRSQRKSQLARYTVALVFSWLGKRPNGSPWLGRFTAWALARGSERVSIGNEACAHGMAVRQDHAQTRSLSQDGKRRREEVLSVRPLPIDRSQSSELAQSDQDRGTMICGTHSALSDSLLKSKLKAPSNGKTHHKSQHSLARPIFANLVWHCFAAAIALAVSVTLVSAQSATDGTTPAALAPGAPAGSYSLSDFENINVFNGNLNARFPLLHIGGRGSSGFTMMLAIEQHWRSQHSESVDSLGNPHYNTYADPNWWEGIKPGYGPGVLQSRSVAGDPVDCNNGLWAYSSALTRLTFSAPDGTEYELIDTLTGGQVRAVAGCYSAPFSRGKVFVSIDGTAVTFISDQPVMEYGGNAGPYTEFSNGVLMFRDGTRYRIDAGLVTSIRDRNGNLTRFSYGTNPQNGLTYQRLLTATDSLNRQVSITYADNINVFYDQISFNGFGGAGRTVRIWHTSLGQVLRAGYSLANNNHLFPEFGGDPNDPNHFNPSVVSALELPDGRRYQFSYNQYSELARVVLPTGGAIEYDHTSTSGVVGCYGAQNCEGGAQIYRRTSERRVYPNGGPPFESKQRWTSEGQGLGTSGDVVTVDQFDTANVLLGRQKHFFFGTATPGEYGMLYYSPWKDGKEYQTDSISPADGITALLRTTNNWQQRAPVSWVAPTCRHYAQYCTQDDARANDPRIVETVTTLMDTNQVSKTTSINPQTGVVGFDQFNNPTDTWTYDYGQDAPGALLRHAHTAYLIVNPVNQVDYTNRSSVSSPHLLSLPVMQSIFDAGEVERARSTFEYDNYGADGNHAQLTERSDISGHDSTFTTSYWQRGNTSATTHYLLNSSGAITDSISGYAQFDIAGNVVKIIDGRGYATTLDYSDCFGLPDGEAHFNMAPGELTLQGQSSYAFPTLITNALGQTRYTQVDYYLGKAVDTEDENGIVSSASYNDDLDRIKNLIRGVNGGVNVKSQTTFSYNDADHVFTTTSDQYGYLDSLLKGELVYDSLGRTIEKRQYESASTYIAVRQTYDALGRTSRTSNPFRPGETIRWTTTGYDDLGRIVSVVAPDNAVVKTAYSGNRVLVADQNESDQLRRKRISKTDALGRLRDLWEVKVADGVTEAVSFPNWPDVTAGYHTSYDYDTLDNLMTVHQGTQTRSFIYDSLRRLSSANNLENGSVSYQYDENGNVRVKTDARGVSAHYSYDALNRVARRWYNGSSSLVDVTNNSPALPSGIAMTDEVAYFYDSQGLASGAPNYSRGYATGRLTAVTYGTGNSSGDYYGYDAAGRQTVKIQQTNGINYQINSDYNLANAVTSLIYPSRDHVNYGYDLGGRTNNMTGTLGDGRNRTYATGITYSPFGGLAQEQFATTTALYHKLHYNIRGQLYDIRMSTSSLQTDEFNWNRGCLELLYGGYAWGQSGPANNGNITAAMHWVPFNDAISDFSYTQDNYSYDSLNRLSSANEIHGRPNWQSTQDFMQSYDYDRWGNRTINPSSSGVNNIQFDKSDAQNTNRLFAPGDAPLQMSQRQMQYDPAGNLTYDSYTGQGTRLYDAENRMTAAQDLNQGWSYYAYDGNGQRVKRNTNGTETPLVYGPAGELLAEYGYDDEGRWDEKIEYGYRNGQLLITSTPHLPNPLAKNQSNTTSTPNTPPSDFQSQLLARNNGLALPEWLKDKLSGSSSVQAVSDASTPLYGPSFPYSSLTSALSPLMPQSGSAKIVFASNREGVAQLYSMNTDGGGLLRLTNDAANDEAPKWSPDNTRIVFQSDRDNVFSGVADIYVMNWDGSGQTRLTSVANDDSAPVWSADGSKIAFQSARNGLAYQVYVMNADGSGQINISNNTSNDSQPSWSPDGTKISFASDRDHPGFSSIYVMNANGTNQTRLTFSDIGIKDEQPAWSRDGSKIAFTSTRDGNKEVYVMNAGGSAQMRLTNTLENDDSPAWSSDGTKIIFRSDRERTCCDPSDQVWVMNADGSNPVDLSNDQFGDYSPSWQGGQTINPPPPNRAEFVWQSVPTVMDAGHSYNVAVQMRNTGSNTWTTGAHYSLGSQNAQDNTTWGMARVSLPSSVAPGASVTFNFTITAPSAPGTYNFQWRMVQDMVEWFGDFTPTVGVAVPTSDPHLEIYRYNADVRWIVTDQLGTPRMIFDQSGSLASAARHDYLPFGEELTGQIGGRTTQQGYTGYTTRQKFTSKERDTETGLDYFGARYYASSQGRFTSADPILTSVRKNHPQTWNRYTYVLNNPLTLVDPLGLDQESAADLARRLQEQRQNQPATTDTVHITEIQLRPMLPTSQDTALIQQATVNMGPLTQTFLNNANQAVQDALGLVAAPQPGAPTNPCRDALLNNFGTADPTTALQAVRTTGGAAHMGPDGITPGPQNVFNGTTTTQTGLVDGSTATGISGFFAGHPEVCAATVEGNVFLNNSFNGESRLERAQTMIHEEVVHVANGRGDRQFAPGDSATPRVDGSHRINEIIRTNCNRLPR